MLHRKDRTKGGADMRLHWFDPPVMVESDKSGHAYSVSHVKKAAEFLTLWEERGAAWETAAIACLGCLHGKIEASEARTAFEDAARACGKLIQATFRADA
ncbi:DUF982 domain-containing protein [Bosea sp. BK604]|uniref:DUF982 domain-containing protein n=1 Tax=Bosea sp. BK604 TaxID=2512180 RepID=UPI001404E88D|nr:DUF982 domain-containing protein [Bosea sp. BK604]